MTAAHPVRAMRAVASREWPAVLAAAALATAVELGLRTMTLPRLARVLGTPLNTDGTAPTMRCGPPPTVAAGDRRKVRAVRRVMRHWPFGDTCLRQALVYGHRLRRLHPTLHLGVAKIDGQVRAHAWLVIAGAVLDPWASAASYSQLSSIPSEETR